MAGFAFVVFGAAALVPAASTYALDPLAICDNGQNNDNQVCQNRGEDANDLIKTLVNTLIFIVGILSVVMIIWGGIMYTISTGDAGRIKKAKDTLTYSIVGLIIAILAFAIVNWVIGLF